MKKCLHDKGSIIYSYLNKETIGGNKIDKKGDNHKES